MRAMTDTIDLTEFDHWVLDPKIRAVIDRCKMLSAEVERLRKAMKAESPLRVGVVYKWQLDKAESQRDELAGVLEDCLEVMASAATAAGYPNVIGPVGIAARAALAKVREGTGSDTNGQ
jgi:hypothetical protein